MLCAQLVFLQRPVGMGSLRGAIFTHHALHAQDLLTTLRVQFRVSVTDVSVDEGRQPTDAMRPPCALPLRLSPVALV